MLEFNEETHEYKVDGVVIPSVTQILLAEGFINPTWYDEYSRTRGKYVHKACALWDRGTLDIKTLDPVVRAYLPGWINFMEYGQFDIIDIEKPLGSSLFAGTPDRVGFLNGDYAILEIKTGKPEPWAGLQLGGYEMLVNIGICKRIVIQLTIEGKYSIHTYKDRSDREIFMAALALYNWKKNNGR